ncbi:hypothetical protein NDU88_001850 [Pleurodeles waltl]|uniref:Uncharacterized protein n=1 Tax=Pleurodeles waltl TaxID=8319 RepID=A0AAV7KR79_PLEWA|nr:hypothetical protein NDU88_001850 [Pleurodeles waltl]
MIRGPREAPERCVTGSERVPSCESLLSEIMAAIHDLKGSLEPWLDAVAIDVGLLRADLQKVSDNVSTVETDIEHLQSTSKAMGEQVRFLTFEHECIRVRLEDQEGRAWRNTVRRVGVPEGAEGPGAERFGETLITDHLSSKRLSSFFMAQAMIGGRRKEQHLQIMEWERKRATLEVCSRSGDGMGGELMPSNKLGLMPWHRNAVRDKAGKLLAWLDKCDQELSWVLNIWNKEGIN